MITEEKVPEIFCMQRLLQVFLMQMTTKIYAKTYWEKKISSKFYDVKGRSYADNDSFPRFWLSLL